MLNIPGLEYPNTGSFVTPETLQKFLSSKQALIDTDAIYMEKEDMNNEGRNPTSATEPNIGTQSS